MRESSLSYPRLLVDLKKIVENTQAVLRLAGKVDILGVTKGCFGSPEVAEAMLVGGVKGLADSRLVNLRKLRQFFPKTPLTLLRQPMRHEIKDALKLADHIIISEFSVCRLFLDAKEEKKDISLILMVEVGDFREGISQGEFPSTFRKIKGLKGIKLTGIAANVGCSFARAPTLRSLDTLRDLTLKAKEEGFNFSVVSGGNSSCLNFLLHGNLPSWINQLRIGEAILLGHETASYQLIPGASRGAFLLEAEMIEVREKQGQKQGVLALGRQDIGSMEVTPLTSGMKTKAISSDHLVVSLEEVAHRVRIGEIFKFVPTYFPLATAMASPYVAKEYIGL